MTSNHAGPSSTPIERLVSPFQRFAVTESSGGIVLLICTAIALVWANSPLAPAYARLWGTPITIGAGALQLSLPLHHWVNDGLMAVFFFLVGLEIKRELLCGELASMRRALLAVAAAAGGMLIPAGLYAFLSAGGVGGRGWGIPMATDIAFALGVLSLLGSRIPTGLKVFLAALAIVDDIGAVLVIALFYTTHVSLQALALALAVTLVTVMANRAGVRSGAVYAALGILLWLAMHASGIHATVAGVVLAALIPARPRMGAARAMRRTRRIADQIAESGPSADLVMPGGPQLNALEELEAVSRLAQAPAQRLERRLHPWVAFGIIPLFALANAGVRLVDLTGLEWRITLGVVAGLVIGKPLGIMAATLIATRVGAPRPAGVGWPALHGVSWLGGIGFTMSLFIAQLAFESETALASAKLGVLAASVLAATVGSALLWRLPRVVAAPEGKGVQ